MIKKTLALACVFVSGIGAGIAGNYVFGTPELYGPFVCQDCTLRTPAPDAGSRAYIDYTDNWLNDGPNYTRLTGDKFVVCNATHCATYTRTASGDYMGSPAVPQDMGTGSGGDGNDGGGAAGGNGGMDTPGSNWGNEPPTCGRTHCSGTVTVGG